MVDDFIQSSRDRLFVSGRLSQWEFQGGPHGILFSDEEWLLGRMREKELMKIKGFFVALNSLESNKMVKLYLKRMRRNLK
jgi:hypothetical protein